MVRRFCEMSSGTSSPSRQITVVDVYDLAAAIGKDFERLIDQFGTEYVRGLMPKVISALETLEALASRNERENEEIVGLQRTLERLEAEKEARKEQRHKFDQELEQVEENYHKEIDRLWAMVKRLELENRSLSSSLSNQQNAAPMQVSLQEEDLKVMLNLKETVELQRDQIKTVQRDEEERKQDLENHQMETERQIRLNRELQRKIKALQNQGRVLVEEKSDLLSLLQQKEQENIELHHALGETEKAKKDLEQTKAQETQELDRDNAPRFTLAELREVLQEKNRLKARVMELEEEMAQLRPAPTPSPQPGPSEKSEEEEEVVYGPINKEPDEKLYPWKFRRNESGVRKFFGAMWSRRRNSLVTSSPSGSADSPKVTCPDQHSYDTFLSMENPLDSRPIEPRLRLLTDDSRNVERIVLELAGMWALDE